MRRLRTRGLLRADARARHGLIGGHAAAAIAPAAGFPIWIEMRGNVKQA